MHRDVFLLGGARTPIGCFQGSLSTVPAPVLGSVAVRAVLERSGIDASVVEETIFGNVLGAGLGQNVARQVALTSGLPPSVAAMTLNKVCGSGLKSAIIAAQAIQCGDADMILAGGTENMSQAPYLLPKARTGYRMGHGEVIDSMICDGLWDVYNDMHMGMCGDRCAEKYDFTRQQQDDFAVASYQRAIQAQSDGRFAAEIVPVEVRSRKSTTLVEQDEELTRFNEEKLRALRPAFGKEGSVTAGNASSINDGAAAVLVASGEKVSELNLNPTARIVGYSSFSREPEWFTLAPVGAVEKLMQQLEWTVDDVDVFEVNEAFSVVPMAVMKDLAVPHDKMNVHGGAVAMGHPIGASGARVLVTLLGALSSRNAQRGIASLCIGGGEAVAMAVEMC